MPTREFQINDIEKVSDRVLVHFDDYRQLKDTMAIQKKVIGDTMTETYNDWLNDRKSAVKNEHFRYAR